MMAICTGKPVDDDSAKLRFYEYINNLHISLANIFEKCCCNGISVLLPFFPLKGICLRSDDKSQI